MRQKTWIRDLGLLILQVPLVITIFKLVPEKRMAALMAGFVFIGIPAFLMFRRFQQPFQVRLAHQLWWLGVGVFWAVFAIPMMALRLWHWTLPFEEISWLGLPGPVWHQLSNKAFMAMMVLAVVAHLIEFRGDKKKKPA